ncbi:hypothetical protein [Pseudomonas typographi]|uniref:Uncharacterized protein n=1 Tax=Pseudomonas typographi TaxID=2715964 RepID=A0ABR7YZV9_9PSED|nr:hypothetical protein [Pseudomonas typographi]MBD1550636.1 hypothetical protein [Pseudomonas typographi]MBD1586779.1 hypothetical protein [Pseudomonas typographi]MBD1598673.1 hypothetical protein [Pseudomonas typographi]
MKLDPNISAMLAALQPNQIGRLAWTLLANPFAEAYAVQAGGMPGQPDPDSPQPEQPGEPTEPGEPTIPDTPPPAPVA